MNKYLEGGELSEAEIMRGSAGHAARSSRALRFGVQEQGRAGACWTPSSTSCRRRSTSPVRASTRRREGATRAFRRRDEPFSALAFKIMTDPFVGSLTFFRVYSGVLNAGDQVLNPVKGKRERIGRILQMHANQPRRDQGSRAGDIAAAAGLKDVTTGDTLCIDQERGSCWSAWCSRIR